MKKLILKLAVAVALVGIASVASAQQVNCAQIKNNIEKARKEWNSNNCVNNPRTFACLSAYYGIINNSRIYAAYCNNPNQPKLVDEDGFKID